MIEALKKMDKKFLITSACLIIVPLLIIILLAILQSCDAKGDSYSKYEERMTNYAKTYFEKHQLLPKMEGKEAVVTLEDLEIDGLKSSLKVLKDDSCTGSVTVRNNGDNYMYIPYLECSEYKTTYLIDKLKKHIVKKESGLYKIGNEYIYKGNKVNNYISLFNTVYRIIGIDSDNNIRLIKNNMEENEISWDTKYNVSTQDSIGINDYYNSYIYDYIWNQYNNKKAVPNDLKKHLIAQNVCLDKKSESDLNKNKVGCTNILKKQYISIPTIYDYTLASFDENCQQLGDGACANYNYMSDVISTTWTINASSDDTYSVYYISGSGIDTRDAETYLPYFWIISINGNEVFNGGNGTLEKPYLIKEK